MRGRAARDARGATGGPRSGSLRPRAFFLCLAAGACGRSSGLPRDAGPDARDGEPDGEADSEPDGEVASDADGDAEGGCPFGPVTSVLDEPSLLPIEASRVDASQATSLPLAA